MDRIEYRDVIDKTGWGQGPWRDEPDKAQWPDEKTGLPCLIVRARTTGALCGYVGVPPGHPWHGVGYDHVRWDNPEAKESWDYSPNVHGGLTFAGGCGHHKDPAKGICHVPDEGEPDDVWWLGFDCAHCDDVSPAIDAMLRECGHNRLPIRSDYGWPVTYKTIEYVADQVRHLADQATKALPPEPKGEDE